MVKLTTCHIALGSNKGEKSKNLQLAVDAIYNHIGAIKRISKVYRSPAFGFEGDDFLNCCLVLQTKLDPQNILDTLLEIESDLGRKRNKKNGYEARVIDLDIVLVENTIINTKTLQVPHPEMHNRKFVLQPLNDIASKVKHPKLGKDIKTLLTECKDNSILELVKIELNYPSKLNHF